MTIPRLLIAVAVGVLIVCQAMGAEHLLSRGVNGTGIYSYVVITSMLVSIVSFVEGFIAK
jgi:hypothetical protein